MLGILIAVGVFFLTVFKVILSLLGAFLAEMFQVIKKESNRGDRDEKLYSRKGI